MNIKDLEKAGEIRQQIKELEKFINHKKTPLEEALILRQDPKFRLLIKNCTFDSDTTLFITSEVLSDAIKVALTRTIEDLKEQLIELGVEVD
ncbi:Uncharacterised protein [Streptococcus pneumoniae]|nr:Uncharacterised protein [Streptococcus pneumoniae]VNV41520.1 Uncharacterised protein [Streptococcus pneumoniae]